MRSLTKKRPMRAAMTRAMRAGVSSSVDGRTQAPVSSNFPTTRGRTSSRQL